jgi:hypothetical protein
MRRIKVGREVATLECTSGSDAGANCGLSLKCHYIGFGEVLVADLSFVS